MKEKYESDCDDDDLKKFILNNVPRMASYLTWMRRPFDMFQKFYDKMINDENKNEDVKSYLIGAYESAFADHHANGIKEYVKSEINAKSISRSQFIYNDDVLESLKKYWSDFRIVMKKIKIFLKENKISVSRIVLGNDFIPPIDVKPLGFFDDLSFYIKTVKDKKEVKIKIVCHEYEFDSLMKESFQSEQVALDEIFKTLTDEEIKQKLQEKFNSMEIRVSITINSKSIYDGYKPRENLDDLYNIRICYIEVPALVDLPIFMKFTKEENKDVLKIVSRKIEIDSLNKYCGSLENCTQEVAERMALDEIFKILSEEKNLIQAEIRGNLKETQKQKKTKKLTGKGAIAIFVKHKSVIDEYSSKKEMEELNQIYNIELLLRDPLVYEPSNLIPELLIYTDGSEKGGGFGSGVFCESENIEESYKLPYHCDSTQAEWFALKKAASILLEKGITDRYITIYSDCESVVKECKSAKKVNAKLTKECRESLMKLCENNKVRLSWNKGHSYFYGNEEADQLAREAAERKPCKEEKESDDGGPSQKKSKKELKIESVGIPLGYKVGLIKNADDVCCFCGNIIDTASSDQNDHIIFDCRDEQVTKYRRELLGDVKRGDTLDLWDFNQCIYYLSREKSLSTMG